MSKVPAPIPWQFLAELGCNRENTMPKKGGVVEEPVLYEWSSVRYGTYPNGTNDGNWNQFDLASDGTWTEITSVNGVRTTETGTVKKKELAKIDALADQINREPYELTTVPQDGDSALESNFTTISWNNDENFRFVHLDYSNEEVEYYGGPDQADIQESLALEAAMRTLDARYGDNFA
jgi:hypothetical protein